MTEQQSFDANLYDSALAGISSSDLSSHLIGKSLLNVPDTNVSGGNYQSNLVTFELSQLANNGKFIAHRDGVFAIPIVIQINSSGTNAVSFAQADTVANDFCVALKNSNLNIINSVTIDVGNQTLVSRVENINQILLFNEHTSRTLEDEEMEKEWGYAKDTGSSFSYVIDHATNQSPIGEGLCNNSNGYDQQFKMSLNAEGDILNSGMADRQRASLLMAGSATYGKSLIYGDSTKIEQMYRQTGKNYVLNTTTAKYIFMTVLIPMKKLPLFDSDSFPRLLRSTYIKVTFSINQCYFEVSKTVDGYLKFVRGTQQLAASTNPLLFASSFKPLIGNASSTITNVDATKTNISCGSAGLKCNETYQCSLSIMQTRYAHKFGAAQRHGMSSPMYYVPAYSLNSDSEAAYLALAQKRCLYRTYSNVIFYGVSQTFNLNVTSGIPKARRMIIMPFLNASSNAGELGNGFSELSSPFSTAPATLAPYQLSNFQCFLGGMPLYAQPLNYNWTNFLSEFSEHEQYGGRINAVDHANLYGYIVVDLRRRLPSDANALQAISISGTLTSLKAVDFYIWFEQENSVIFDIVTGQTADDKKF